MSVIGLTSAPTGAANASNSMASNEATVDRTLRLRLGWLIPTARAYPGDWTPGALDLTPGDVLDGRAVWHKSVSAFLIARYPQRLHRSEVV